MPIVEPTTEALARRNTSLSDILACCPFDPNRNLGGSLSEDFFFQHVFVHTDHFVEVESQLLRLLTSNIHSRRIISFHGFSGIGTTTFLKYFQRTAIEFHHVHLDFHALYRHAQPGYHVRPATRSIKAAEQGLREVLQSNSFSEEIG